MANVAKDFAQLISQSKSNKTGPYDTQATVKRVEGNTVWVSIPGGVDETPIDKTVNCTAGDKVQVRVSGGRAWITGNASAPPTDDKTANEAKGVAVIAQTTAVDAKETADAVEGIAVSASTTATTAKTIAEGVNEHFWHDNTGAHVTEVTREEWNEPTDPNYHSGGNTLITTQGMAIRVGLNELATFGVNGQTFNNDYLVPVLDIGRLADTSYNGKIEWFVYSNETPFEITLSWGVNSITNVIAYNGGSSVYTVSSSNYTLNNRTITINAAGCSGIIAAGGTSIRVLYSAQGRFPYFTIGSRKAGRTIGSFSTVIGENCVAQSPTSFAAGDSTIVNGANGFATGIDTTAGQNCFTAGKGTKADISETVAIGRYNVPPDNTNHYAYCIGNGTADNARSNALTVDWSGNVEAAGSITVEGHDSEIGYRPTRQTGSYSLASGTSWVTVPSSGLARTTLSQGVWIIQAQAIFASNSTGWRALRIYDVTTSENIGRSGVTQPAVNGATTNLTTTAIISLTTSNAFTLQITQNSGAARKVDLTFDAVRIA